MKYYSITEMLGMIDRPNREACQKLYTDNVELFKSAYGSTSNHQDWIGGYHGHIQEVMNICTLLYPVYSVRKIKFSLSDALLIMFLHDIEKPWKYELYPDSDGHQRLRVKAELVDKKAQHIFRESKITEYGIELNDAQKNALKYVEGEKDDYSSEARVMNELAAFCHIADVSSARIWHNYPKEEMF